VWPPARVLVDWMLRGPSRVPYTRTRAGTSGRRMAGKGTPFLRAFPVPRAERPAGQTVAGPTIEKFARS
jgi:hypothetical protein